MPFFNHYSAPILAAVLLAGGLSLVWRRGGKTTHWLILGGATVALGAVWWVFRPVATLVTPVAGLPLLLEVQSPYCLGCVAIKPAVDRLESELHGRLVLRRVDIQSAEGRKLANQYGIELTPTFIFFDAAGKEQWRSVGQLDAARVRTSLAPLAKDAGNRPPAHLPSACAAKVLVSAANTPSLRLAAASSRRSSTKCWGFRCRVWRRWSAARWVIEALRTSTLETRRSVSSSPNSSSGSETTSVYCS